MRALSVTLCMYFMCAAPTGAPERIVYYASFQTIRAYWSEIPCSDHNGQITNYVYQLRQVGGALVPDDQLQVVDMNFTATGLTPNTNYILRVAGININGTGPFATVRILTRNDSKIKWSSSSIIIRFHFIIQN